MESLLSDMRRLGQAVAGAATIHEAETLVPDVKALAEKRAVSERLVVELLDAERRS